MVSDLLRPLLGARVGGMLGGLVNVFAVVATAVGVATTLGLGAVQISAGLEHVVGVKASFSLELLVIAVAFLLYMTSSATGLDRGIKWLSNINIAVREFVFGVVLGLALVSFLWFSAFGGTALYQQLFGGMDLAAALSTGYEHVLFASLGGLPLSTLLSWISILLLLSFFVTWADSATLVLASMSSESQDDPPMVRRVVWGVMQAAIAVALLAARGLQALQGGYRGRAAVRATAGLRAVLAAPSLADCFPVAGAGSAGASSRRASLVAAGAWSPSGARRAEEVKSGTSSSKSLRANSRMLICRV